VVSLPSDRPTPAKKQDTPLELGSVVADKYKIESLLGEGGMGFVFAALHLQLGHRVAIKVLPSAALADRDVTERFLREGRALARLQGEHIARVSDVGTLPTGEPYLVMELLEGRDLARELAARGPLPLVETVDMLAQACEALVEAHVRGIIHRDLKPANLFLTHKLDGEPCVKVLDFGISKVAAADGELDERENITVTSTLVGTPKYMSPEQIQDSRSVDARTDIWGLGTIFYELLTQKRPFAAPSLALVCVKVLQEDVPAPSTIRPEIPPEVDAVIARCLQKDPANRYANVGELIEALVPIGPPAVRSSAARVMRILASRSSSARLGADSSGSLPNVTGARTPSAVRFDGKDIATLSAATLLEGTARSKKKRRLSWIVGAGGGAFLIGMVLFVALHSSKPAQTTATSAASGDVPAKTASPPATTPATAEAKPQPSAAESAAPSASAAASEAAKTHVVVHHVVVHHVHTQTTHGASTASTESTSDILEDRR
jgi:serine/threonine protein kinase